MATKSRELLTKAAQTEADKLRQKGWKQKEYMSTGIVALSRLSPEEQLKCKEIAYSMEYCDNSDLHDAIQHLVKVITGTASTIKILPAEENKIIENIKKLLGPKETHLHPHKKAGTA